MDNLHEDKFVQLISKIPNVAVQGYDKERNVIYWNKASEKIYGYSSKEALGKKLEDLIIHDFMKNDVISHIKNWYDNGIEIPSSQLPLKHKNGHTIYVFSSHVMLKDDSKNPEMFCIDVDLTEQVKKEEELKKKDEILTSQAKMASMGEMLDNIAHQWKQPLSMVTSTVTGIQVQNQMNILNDDCLNRSLNSIIETTRYMSQTVEDFRSFVRGTHKKTFFDLFDIIRYSLQLSEGVLKKNNIEVILSTDFNGIKILGYPNELVQVIINLISNSKDAFKKTQPKKRVIFIDVKEDKNRAILKIKDNAGGILEDKIDRIFEAGFTTKEEEKNGGIGLYMSKKLINESMHGTIEVKNKEFSYESMACLGVEFTITLEINL